MNEFCSTVHYADGWKRSLHGFSNTEIGALYVSVCVKSCLNQDLQQSMASVKTYDQSS